MRRPSRSLQSLVEKRSAMEEQTISEGLKDSSRHRYVRKLAKGSGVLALVDRAGVHGRRRRELLLGAIGHALTIQRCACSCVSRALTTNRRSSFWCV